MCPTECVLLHLHVVEPWIARGHTRTSFEFEIYLPYLCAWPRTSGLTTPFMPTLIDHDSQHMC